MSDELNKAPDKTYRGITASGKSVFQDIPPSDDQLVWSWFEYVRADLVDPVAIRKAALQEAAELFDVPPAFGGVARSMAFFVDANDHAKFKQGCQEYRDAILALIEKDASDETA